jgi:hypothetical protein
LTCCGGALPWPRPLADDDDEDGGREGDEDSAYFPCICSCGACARRFPLLLTRCMSSSGACSGKCSIRHTQYVSSSGACQVVLADVRSLAFLAVVPLAHVQAVPVLWACSGTTTRNLSRRSRLDSRIGFGAGSLFSVKDHVGLCHTARLLCPSTVATKNNPWASGTLQPYCLLGRSFPCPSSSSSPCPFPSPYVGSHLLPCASASFAHSLDNCHLS